MQSLAASGYVPLQAVHLQQAQQGQQSPLPAVPQTRPHSHSPHALPTKELKGSLKAAVLHCQQNNNRSATSHSTVPLASRLTGTVWSSRTEHAKDSEIANLKRKLEVLMLERSVLTPGGDVYVEIAQLRNALTSANSLVEKLKNEIAILQRRLRVRAPAGPPQEELVRLQKSFDDRIQAEHQRIDQVVLKLLQDQHQEQDPSQPNPCLWQKVAEVKSLLGASEDFALPPESTGDRERPPHRNTRTPSGPPNGESPVSLSHSHSVSASLNSIPSCQGSPPTAPHGTSTLPPGPPQKGPNLSMSHAAGAPLSGPGPFPLTAMETDPPHTPLPPAELRSIFPSPPLTHAAPHSGNTPRVPVSHPDTSPSTDSLQPLPQSRQQQQPHTTTTALPPPRKAPHAAFSGPAGAGTTAGALPLLVPPGGNGRPVPRGVPGCRLDEAPGEACRQPAFPFHPQQHQQGLMDPQHTQPQDGDLVQGGPYKEKERERGDASSKVLLYEVGEALHLANQGGETAPRRAVETSSERDLSGSKPPSALQTRHVTPRQREVEGGGVLSSNRNGEGGRGDFIGGMGEGGDGRTTGYATPVAPLTDRGGGGGGVFEREGEPQGDTDADVLDVSEESGVMASGPEKRTNENPREPRRRAVIVCPTYQMSAAVAAEIGKGARGGGGASGFSVLEGPARDARLWASLFLSLSEKGKGGWEIHALVDDASTACVVSSVLQDKLEQNMNCFAAAGTADAHDPLGGVRAETEKETVEQPCQSRVLRALQWLVKGAQRGDELAFVFSGMSTVVENSSGVTFPLLLPGDCLGVSSVSQPSALPGGVKVKQQQATSRGLGLLEIQRGVSEREVFGVLSGVPEGVSVTTVFDCPFFGLSQITPDGSTTQPSTFQLREVQGGGAFQEIQSSTGRGGVGVATSTGTGGGGLFRFRSGPQPRHRHLSIPVSSNLKARVECVPSPRLQCSLLRGAVAGDPGMPSFEFPLWTAKAPANVIREAELNLSSSTGAAGGCLLCLTKGNQRGGGRGASGGGFTGALSFPLVSSAVRLLHAGLVPPCPIVEKGGGDLGNVNVSLRRVLTAARQEAKDLGEKVSGAWKVEHRVAWSEK
uniref:Uncharacterized protein n=1 Tax=Chromera velia CCMP2878 TaxID=1169474 RepID=A0A0G4FR38_9ALVE|eukprot:Cvel_18307.t1-p1 / transcript=Cvel_18307.t1 / gene=Cvel_18307 / organism=Chromera_velia_CCMP2878 / gene_product=hypothetical protein / transcript_product=hypothetical protein / location=Cvel_scaffold1510:9053-12830(-) / protein_length=1098 / sequence_SO=supercontig / SO=protein_coding / is_pseudo=false